jgi:hypothetical protein
MPSLNKIKATLKEGIFFEDAAIKIKAENQRNKIKKFVLEFKSENKSFEFTVKNNEILKAWQQLEKTFHNLNLK